MTRPLAALILLATTSLVHAQEPARPTTGQVNDHNLAYNFALGGSYTTPADLEAGRGDLAIWRADAELSLSAPLTSTSRLNLSARNQWSWYDFSRGDKPLVGDSFGVFSQVVTTNLRASLNQRLDDRWSLLAGFDIDASGETDADVGDSLTYGGILAARYSVNPGLTFTLGFVVRSVLEDGVQYIPAAGVDWKFAEQWRLTLLGPTARVTWRPRDNFDIYTRFAYEGRDFRLADDGPLPDGVVRDGRVTLALGINSKLTESLTLSSELGITPWGVIDFADPDGDKLASYDLKPAAFFALSVEYSW
jgi:hypothetical protein